MEAQRRNPKSMRLVGIVACLLPVIGALAIGCYVMPRIIAARHDAQLAKALGSLGGEFCDGDTLAFFNGVDDDRLCEACAMVRDRVSCVWLPRSQVSDKGIKALATISRLRKVGLNGASISDSGIPVLAKLRDLEELDLGDTNVSDADLSALRDMRSLRRLRLVGTKIRGSGLAFLAELPNLRELDLALTEVDDDAVCNVVKMKHLEYLFLDGTNVTNASAAELRDNLKMLKSCDLLNVPIIEEDAQGSTHVPL